MTRRQLFRNLAVGAGAIAGAPLLALVPAAAPTRIVIPMRKMITRIRVTEEVLRSSVNHHGGLAGSVVTWRG